jgi:enoyl-CoA hydratase
MMEDVLFEKRGRGGIITLNRPKALNALTLDMVHAMREQLSAWRDDRDVELVLIRGAGERAFCAGGDIRALYDSGKSGNPYAIDFYAHEYRLNTMIKRYPKPYVALINGIAMGGGVGVSVHGHYRIAGEGCVFAMPETGIGLFPDVGGTHFLPRMPGETGMYIALTGSRMNVVDCFATGIATHMVPASGHELLIQTLCEGDAPLEQALTRAAVRPSEQSRVMGLRPLIDRHFVGGSVEDIQASLADDKSLFASETLKALQTKSPTSLKVTYRQIREGAKLGFEECMRLEFRLTNRFMAGHDFYEGVRALIIDKDQAPKWNPARLEDVSDAALDSYFEPLPKGDLDLAA